ncbi:hypothetical protein CCY99_06310 [Helicobacter sp. 16-1353]|uniref:radical SAM family heme chaperone HemW n=1 Tax=Helicobacter sp. 16-1353 TaxID=2004996 RepID=UPI000DCB4802|nr:radical SAM family heme chaperone HemW [Helicobacter sp. 16-1353]RAX53201.1 hypothetical protein CCY99_06310 [Helicobacter sp. 16-1353]
MLLYIHIPFCDSKCGYCGFNSLTNKLDSSKIYLESLKLDLIEMLQNTKEIETIYIGGGTPNTLNPSDYEEIFKILQSYITNDTEITIELNPNQHKESLPLFKNLGINRFSIGVQSFRDEKLRLLERNHNPKIAIEFIENAIKCGISTSIDMIYDTKLDNAKSIKDELKLANSLGVGHVSCYALSIDKNSRFYTKHKNPILNNTLCYEIKEILESYNFHQYEVSNYAKTHKSKHNLGYWQYKEYIGIGLGAVSRIQNKRIYKQNDFHSYIKNPLQILEEKLSNEDKRLERIFLGLRSEVGVDICDIYNKSKLDILLDSKKCKKVDSRIYATNYFLADELSLWLM